MTKSTKKNIINLTVLLALIALTLVILCLSNRELNFRGIRDFLRSSKAVFLIAAFACMLLYILFEAVSLFVIERTLGHKCKFRQSIVYSTADVYYSAITPSAAGGQPASAYYMVQDGVSGGAATFTLVFNLIAYTSAIIVLGAAAFVLRPAMFADFGTFAKVLVILGIVLQLLLLGFFIACMFWHRAVFKCGNGLITLLTRMKIIRKEEKWRRRLTGVIEKYASCLGQLREHRALFAIVLLLNILQRASQMLVPCFVISAVTRQVPFLDIFVMQAYVTLGYNAIPLPGGVGAFEYLYLHIYSLRFEDAFILSAMMVTRTISYYISLILSGAITLCYHGILIRRKGRAAVRETAEEFLAEQNLSLSETAISSEPKPNSGAAENETADDPPAKDAIPNKNEDT